MRINRKTILKGVGPLVRLFAGKKINKALRKAQGALAAYDGIKDLDKRINTAYGKNVGINFTAGEVAALYVMKNELRQVFD